MNINKYSTFENNIKIMFKLLKKVFIALLRFIGSIVRMTNASNLTTCMFLNHQQCISISTLVSWNPDKLNQRIRLLSIFF